MKKPIQYIAMTAVISQMINRESEQLDSDERHQLAVNQFVDAFNHNVKVLLAHFKKFEKSKSATFRPAFTRPADDEYISRIEEEDRHA